jgi:zinc protease
MTGTELLERIHPVARELANGLTVLVRRSTAAPVAAIVTHVRAGYFDEPDDRVGVSHVLEHMFFKGTERRGPGEIARATKAVGGLLNAGTIYDRTTYYTVLPSSAVELGLDIQADALLNARIDEAELRAELQVIIEEVKRKRDNPSALATEKLYEAMFDGHPMRRWRMGTEETLARLSRADVLDYYRERYRAGNTVLVVVGHVDPSRVIDRVESLYGSMAPGGSDDPGRREPDRAGPRFREMSGDIGHSYAEMGWRTPGTLHEDTPALDVLAVLLGQGRASRLYRGVRERGLASSVGATHFTPTEIGVFGVGLECEAEDTQEALAAAWSELAGAGESAPPAAELERVRALVEARLLRRLETVEGQANLLAQWQALGDWRLAGRYLDRVQTLDPDRLADVSRRHLAPDRVTLLVYRPATAPALAWADDDVVARISARRPPPATLAEPPVLRAVAAVTPAPAARVEDGVYQYALDGGRVVVKPRRHAPLVAMTVCRAGGVPHEGRATAGITGLLARTSLKGTARRSAEEIAVATEALGGSMGASAAADLVSWSLTVPSGRFPEAWSLLADVAFRPTFPGGEVAKERAMALADLKRLRDDMYRYPLRLLLTAAFAGHPYGLGVEEAEHALAGLEPRQLEDWHRRALGEPCVLVVGDVEPERVVDLVAGDLADPGLAAPALDGPPPPVWPAEPRREEVRRARAQTAMALGFPGPSRNDPDRIRLDVLSSAVSGLGNRLFEELRSRRSLAYTVSAHPVARLQAGLFVGYIATSPERAEEARAGLIEEVARLASEPPDEDELERARNVMLGSWQIRSQTNVAQLSELASALVLGPGLEEIREYEARVRAVGRDDVAAAASRWLDASRVVEGVVRGA